MPIWTYQMVSLYVKLPLNMYIETNPVVFTSHIIAPRYVKDSNTF